MLGDKRDALWMVALAVLMLAALACTCGPLANLTSAASTLEAAATEVGEVAPTIQAQMTSAGPIVEGNLPMYDAGDGYETSFVREIAVGGTDGDTFTSVFDAHNYVFEGNAGQIVTIRITGAAGDLDTRAKLIDPNGTLLVEEDDTEGVNPVIVYTLPMDGLYTIRIDTWSEGSYTVTVSEGAPSGGVTGGGPAVGSGQMLNQWAFVATASSEYGNDSWSAMQATGAPDTPECGDYATAWASLSSTGVEWLRLEYVMAVIPTHIAIHESYNPGAITKVEVVDTNGNTTVVYEGAPEIYTEACPTVFEGDVTNVSTPVQTVIVTIDQTNHTGWNEIDAVELVGTVP